MNDQFTLLSQTAFFYVGKQNLIHFSEGVKQSLRRLSNVTWMAEELHRVADFLLPNISVSTHACTNCNTCMNISSQQLT